MALKSIKSKTFALPKLPAIRFSWQLLLGLFLFLRVLTLLTSVEWVSDWEELYRGTIAKELVEGLKMPFWDYQADTYSGGSLVVGLMAAPLFKILGPSLFALKCVPLFFSAATLVFLFFLIKKYFGPRPAAFSALFLIFCPPSFAQFSLVAMGYHSESIFFSVILLHLFCRMWERPKARSRQVMCGIASGIAFWFTHITAVTILTCLLSWFLYNRKSFFSGLFAFALSSLIGLAPWFAYNCAHGWKGLDFVLCLFLRLHHDSAGPMLELSPLKLARLLLRGLPLSFSFSDHLGLPGWFWCYGYYGTVLLSLFFLVQSLRRKTFPAAGSRMALLPFLLYPGVYLLIYWMSRMGVVYVTPKEPFYRFFEFRYFVPLQFFLFCLLAFSAEASKWGKYAAFGLWGLGLLGQRPLFFQENPGRAFHYKGYSYASMGVTLEQSEPFPGSLDHFLKVIENRPDLAETSKIARGFFGWGVVLPENSQNLDALLRSIAKVPAVYHPALMQGLGMSLSFEVPEERELPRKLLENQSASDRDFFYLGFSSVSKDVHRSDFLLRYPAFFLPDQPEYKKWSLMHFGQYAFSPEEKEKWEESLRRLPALSAAEQSWFYRGVGEAAVIYWVFRKGRFETTSSQSAVSVPPAFERDFYWGAGWEIARELGEDEVRARDWLARLPAVGWASAQEGFQSGLEMFWSS